MPELTDTEGAAVEGVDPVQVNQSFAAAMAAPVDGEGTQAPPKRAPAPELPAGGTKRRGRPPKAERARVEAGRAKAASGPLSDEQRAQGVQGMIQIGAGMCALGSKLNGSVALRADAITLASSAGEIADAVVQTARSDERFAAVVDKIAAAGPYGALITVMFGVGMQVARNHRPTVAFPGTLDPAELVRRAEQQQAEAVNGVAAAA